GLRALCLPVRPGEQPRAAARADRSHLGRVRRQLPAGVQSHRRDRRRRHARQSDDVIDRLVVFGGTGDLTGRYLLPGLAALLAQGHISDRFEFVGASREDWNDERYRAWTAGWLRREAAGVEAGASAALVRASRYRRLDLSDPANVAACLA